MGGIVPTESQICKAFVEWCNWNKAKVPELNMLIKIPNEGKRTKWFGKKLKDEGMRSGIPDYFLAVGTEKGQGLWLEFKSKRGKLSKNQLFWINELMVYGYDVAIPESLDQAIKFTLTYLGKTL